MVGELNAWRQQADRLADLQLMAELRRLVKVDRACEARILVLLAELDVRELYLAHGYSSLFRYATNALRMSEAQAYLRIRAARVARTYPVVLEMLVEGALSLSTLKLLAPHLTADNHVALLEQARDKNKHDVELLVAEVAPQPDVPTRLRKLPAARANTIQAELLMPAALKQSSATAQAVEVTNHHAAAPASAVEVTGQGAAGQGEVTQVVSAAVLPAAAAAVAPPVASTFVLEAPRASCTVLRPARYKLELTANQELYEQLMKLQHLLKHRVPGGDLSLIVGLAIEELVQKLEKQRFAQLAKPARGHRDQASQSRAPAASPDAGSSPQTGEVEPSPTASLVDPTAGSSQPPSEVGPKAESVEAGSRYVPRAVVRAVFARDGAQCTFVSADGQRCAEREMLELHHVQAFALGGASTLENLKVVCRSHNAYLATRDFGAAHMRAMRAGLRTSKSKQ